MIKTWKFELQFKPLKIQKQYKRLIFNRARHPQKNRNYFDYLIFRSFKLHWALTTTDHSRDQRINSPRNPQITIIFKTQTATIKSPSRESLLEANRENRKSVFIYCSIIFWLEFASLLVVGTSIDSPVRNQIRRRIKWPPWPIKEMQSTCNNLHTRSNTLLCLFNWIVTCRADGQGHPAVFQQCTYPWLHRQIKTWCI